MSKLHKIKKIIRKGFTLIELMIVLAIIGILLTVASNEYAYYIARAQATEAINFMAPIRISAIEFYATYGRFPNFAELMEMNPFMTSTVTPIPTSGAANVDSRYVSLIGTSAGGGAFKIESVFKTTDISAKLAGRSIRLISPTNQGARNAITWKCQTNVPAANYAALPAICRSPFNNAIGTSL